MSKKNDENRIFSKKKRKMVGFLCLFTKVKGVKLPLCADPRFLPMRNAVAYSICLPLLLQIVRRSYCKLYDVAGRGGTAGEEMYLRRT